MRSISILHTAAMVNSDLIVELESEPLSDLRVCLDYVVWFTAKYSFSAKALSGYVLVSEQYLHYVQSPRAVSTPDLIKTGNANQQVFL